MVEYRACKLKECYGFASRTGGFKSLDVGMKRGDDPSSWLVMRAPHPPYATFSSKHA
jgi:hypothetical protein